MATRISTAVAKAMCDAMAAKPDAGTGAGYVEVRTGSQPATVATAASGTLLATLTLSDPAFDAATTASPAVATANPIADDASADASGTAGWFRCYDSSGTAVIDGSVTATGGGGDMTFDTAAFVAGGDVHLSGWTVSQPTS